MYALTLSSTSATKDEFYDNLSAIISSIQSKEQIIILGDFKAIKGTDVTLRPHALDALVLKK